MKNPIRELDLAEMLNGEEGISFLEFIAKLKTEAQISAPGAKVVLKYNGFGDAVLRIEEIDHLEDWKEHNRRVIDAKILVANGKIVNIKEEIYELEQERLNYL